MSKKILIDHKYEGYPNSGGLTSHENGVKDGDVRYIDDTFYVASTVFGHWFKKDEVHWWKVRHFDDMVAMVKEKDRKDRQAIQRAAQRKRKARS